MHLIIVLRVYDVELRANQNTTLGQDNLCIDFAGVGMKTTDTDAGVEEILLLLFRYDIDGTAQRVTTQITWDNTLIDLNAVDGVNGEVAEVDAIPF